MKAAALPFAASCALRRFCRPLSSRPIYFPSRPQPATTARLLPHHVGRQLHAHRQRYQDPSYLTPHLERLLDQQQQVEEQEEEYEEEEEEHEDGIMSGFRSTSTTASGSRRKKGGTAYYAVRIGRVPGVYLSWDDCQTQTSGCPDADHRKFYSLAEAEKYVKEGAATAKPKAGKRKWYAVRNGNAPGIYTDWSVVKPLVTGVKKPDMRSFTTEEAAQEYMKAGFAPFPSDASASMSIRGDADSDASTLNARQGCKASEPPSKKQKKNDGSVPIKLYNSTFELGTGPLPPGAEDGFDPTIMLDPASGSLVHKNEDQRNAQKLQPTGEFTGPIRIWTDGSSLGNGTDGAIAGVGVYFGSNDPRNVSEPLDGKTQTNQRAELTAISRALDNTPIDKDVKIYTDSHYSIKCVTEWCKKWIATAKKNKRSVWINSSGSKVENQDLIEPIVNRIEERTFAKAKTEFQWLKGHAGDYGNTKADELAVNGARAAQQLLGAPDFID